jgi:hypothetical protein
VGVEVYPYTTGYIIDNLEIGQIAESNLYAYITRKSYGFIWCEKDGTFYENKYFYPNDITLDFKWRVLN